MRRTFTPDSHGRVHVSSRAMELSIDALHGAMKEAGYQVSRATAGRAKKRGWFSPGYRDGAYTLAGDHLAWVGLSVRERQLGPSEVARRFGIDPATARKAIDRGWFSVTRSNRDRVTVAQGRIRYSQPPPPRQAVAPIVPEVIRSAPDGRPLGQLEVAEIVSIFGLSSSKAARIRLRGEIRTKSWPAHKRLALAASLAALSHAVDDEAS